MLTLFPCQLTAIIVSMQLHVPPVKPWETYSQGYWYAILAAILYCICSGLLMINMLGYFLGHYPQRFNLNDHQRTLILQTMMFFIWLSVGGAAFSSIENRHADPALPRWTFTDGVSLSHQLHHVPITTDTNLLLHSFIFATVFITLSSWHGFQARTNFISYYSYFGFWRSYLAF
jgi:hypothetical protein